MYRNARPCCEIHPHICHRCLQDYLEAEAEIKRGLDAEPTNAELTKLHTRLKALQKRQNKKEAAMYSKMFA